jgi:hypothetical protein
MRAALRQVLFRSAGLDLNFAGGVFSLNNTRTDSPANIPGWSFLRTDTNGTATALDLAGNVIQFATGVPRITNRGILVEEARTNLLLNSATLSTQSVTTTAVAHTLSFYGTGTVTLTGTSTAGPLVGTGASNRVTLTFTPTAGTLTLTVTGSVTTAQLEAGAFATSPIITTGAAGTRGADSALVNSLPALPTAFTMVAEWSREGGTDAATSYRVASLSRVADDSYSEIYQRHTNNVVRAFQRTLAANQADVTLGTGSIGSVQRTAARFVTNDVTGSFNGAAVVSDTVVTMPASPPLSFAAGSTNGTSGWLNGYIRRVQVLPFAATDAQLQALTAP